MRKAIFWDFDGTLTYSDHLWSRSLLAALGPTAGQLGITREMLAPSLSRGFPWHPDGDPSLRGEEWWIAVNQILANACLSVGVPGPEAHAAARRAREIILSPGSYRVRPDAAAALAVCAYRGWRNYILSNNYPELEQAVKALGLDRFFSGYVVSGAVGLSKPDEKIFRFAERAAKFPSLIWLVGDSPSADVAGANNAGWHSAYLAKPGAAHIGAEVTVDSLSGLLSYL